MIAAIDRELAMANALEAEASARIAALDDEQASIRHHPHYAIYRHGGIAAVRNMGVAHILAHAEFYRLRYGEAIARLAEARQASRDDCLISALKLVCESDPLLEIAGLAWLDSQGLLIRGALNPFWLKQPKLGLGYPARLHGLTAEDAEAHRGLYALTPPELAGRFAEEAESAADTFGDLLPAVIAAGGAQLAAIGTAATEADAAERYWAKCASFAAHQRATGDRRWRWKPPLSRQGHHARTIANLNDVAMPSERTRGHAAAWLDDNGANPRFRKG
ncbi:hypothetical protein [Sphingomonas sp.]|uniref:hypothetical protein n=1 Tax=Sphingomonas sp. TaxID=28214 RepID=UPI0035BBDA9C